jgi:hypothetical protein
MRPDTAARVICSRIDDEILSSAIEHEHALDTRARAVAPLKRLR